MRLMVAEIKRLSRRLKQLDLDEVRLLQCLSLLRMERTLLKQALNEELSRPWAGSPVYESVHELRSSLVRVRAAGK